MVRDLWQVPEFMARFIDPINDTILSQNLWVCCPICCLSNDALILDLQVSFCGTPCKLVPVQFGAPSSFCNASADWGWSLALRRDPSHLPAGLPVVACHIFRGLFCPRRSRSHEGLRTRLDFFVARSVLRAAVQLGCCRCFLLGSRGRVTWMLMLRVDCVEMVKWR